VSESASFCIVRHGFAWVPVPVRSDPVVADTRSHDAALKAAGVRERASSSRTPPSASRNAGHHSRDLGTNPSHAISRV
jgi:hypothetical protein